MRSLFVAALLFVAAPVSAATIELELAPNAQVKTAPTYRIVMEVGDMVCSTAHVKGRDPAWYRTKICPQKAGFEVELELAGADLHASTPGTPGKRVILWRLDRLDGSVLEVAMTRR